MKQYYIKLINGEKLLTDAANFDKWLYNSGDDYIMCFGDSGTILFVKKTKILLAYILGNDDEE